MLEGEVHVGGGRFMLKGERARANSIQNERARANSKHNT